MPGNCTYSLNISIMSQETLGPFLTFPISLCFGFFCLFVCIVRHSPNIALAHLEIVAVTLSWLLSAGIIGMFYYTWRFSVPRVMWRK